MNDYTGWGVPDIEGPAEESPTENLPVRGPSPRREILFGSVGVAVLLLFAAVSFWASGSDRADVTIQSLGIAFVAVAIGVVALGVYLSRGD
jgi:hypothetical protein